MTFKTKVFGEDKNSLEEGLKRRDINGINGFLYVQWMIYLLVILLMVVMGWAGLMYMGFASNQNYIRCDKMNVESGKVNGEFLNMSPPDDKPSQSIPNSVTKINPEENIVEIEEPPMTTAIVDTDEAETQGNAMTFKDVLYSIPREFESTHNFEGASDPTTTIKSVTNDEISAETFKKMKIEPTKETEFDSAIHYVITYNDPPETTESAVDDFSSMLGSMGIQQAPYPYNLKYPSESDGKEFEYDDDIIEARDAPLDWFHAFRKAYPDVTDEDTYEDSVEKFYPTNSHQDTETSTAKNIGMPDLTRLPILRFGRSAHYPSSTKITTSEEVDSSDESEEHNDSESSSAQKTKRSVASPASYKRASAICKRMSVTLNRENIEKIAKQLIIGDDTDPIIETQRQEMRDYIIRVFWKVIIVNPSGEWRIVGENGTEAINVQHLLAKLRNDFATNMGYGDDILASSPPMQELSQQFRNLIESEILGFETCVEENVGYQRRGQRSQNKRVVRSFFVYPRRSWCFAMNCGIVDFRFPTYDWVRRNRARTTEENKDASEIDTDNQHHSTTASSNVNSKYESAEGVYAPPNSPADSEH